MANPLTASLISSGRALNTALPGDTVSFKFSNPPSSVSAVEIDIQQAQFQQGQTLIPGSVLATFEGEIKNGQYVPRKATGRPLPPRTHMPLTLTDGTNNLKVGLVDNGIADLRNELQIAVAGTIGATRQTFRGNAALFVEYPLVMIVSALPPNPVRDPSLIVVPSWAADQWQKKNPPLRTVVTVLANGRLPGPPPLASNEYDPLVAAFGSAVSAAPGGIIALATGHGDGGQSPTGTPSQGGTPWCNLRPENIAKIVEPDGSERFPHRLLLFVTELNDGIGLRGSDGIVHTPGANTIVKLQALDRIADVLKTARLPIRKVLLHTCNVGNSQNFTQLLSDRLQSPVQAHLDFIDYTGAAGSGNILAHYDSDKPQSPRDLTEWPLSKASTESIPGKPPRRWP
jgi:hypothetical protein